MNYVMSTSSEIVAGPIHARQRSEVEIFSLKYCNYWKDQSPVCYGSIMLDLTAYRTRLAIELISNFRMAVAR